MMRLPLTTLCYVEREGRYLMLHRNRRAQDVNYGKWIGVGGHFEAGESPEDCMKREVEEETGLTPVSWHARGVVTFVTEHECEYMHLFTVEEFTGTLRDCDEGELAWVDKSEVEHLPIWEGDRIFLRLLAADTPYFSLKLTYRGDRLAEAVLDGRVLSQK